MFFELPVAQKRDFSDIAGVPPGTDAIGVGDIDLKFLWNPKALGFSYGKDGNKERQLGCSARILSCLRLPTMHWPAIPCCSHR